jgi:hypothetical protein
MYLNRQHAAQRQAIGKIAAKVDQSMVPKKDLGVSKAQDMEENQQQERLVDDKGLADVTDLRNEDFIYVY